MVEEIKDKILSFVSERLVIDGSREKFVRLMSKELCELNNDKLVGRNRFRKLLLGRKSVGKTALVKALVDGCSHTYSDMICVYIILSNDSEQKLPFECIMQEIVSNVSDKIDYALLIDILKSRNKKVFLVIDEFQDIFTSMFDAEFSRRYVSQLCTIAESTDGMIHCIITGSSSVLRRLCFRKYKKDGEKDSVFPNYNAVDMNSTKFQPHSIFPHLGKSFMNFLSCCRPEITSMEEIRDCYVNTGGNAGLVLEYDFNNKVSMYTISSKKYYNMDIYKPTLNTLCNLTLSMLRRNSIVETVDDLVDDLSRTTRIFDLSQIRREVSNEKSLCEKQQLYDLSDEGVIYFDDVNSQIGFGNAYVFYEILSMMSYDHLLNADELMQIKYCTPNAELVLLRLLARESKSWLGVPLTTTTVEELDIDKLGSYDINDLEFRMFKELRNMKDCNGIDAVVIESKESEYTIHRIQLKHMSSKPRLDKSENLNILTQIDKSHDICFKLYENKFKTVSIRYYLVTTKECNPNDFESACTSYKKLNVTLIGRRNLESIWPHALKELDSNIFGKLKK